MKFPYKLSKERLSLLSKEDRELYELEHSSYMLLQNEMNYIRENSEELEDKDMLENPDDEDIHSLIKNSDDLTDAEELDLFDAFDEVLYEVFGDIIEEDLKNCYGEENYDDIKKELLEISSDIFKQNKQQLNEGVPGHDMTFWMGDISWIGKLAGAALTGLAGTAAWLIMQGKDKLAMAKLKKYMNKLVELTDQGLHKKKPWYSFLMPSKIKNNLGEHNNTCFRNIEETALRNIACATMNACLYCGMVNPERATDIMTGDAPQEGSGLDMFKKNIVDKINFIKK